MTQPLDNISPGAGVYRIVNQMDGKIYVGSAKSLSGRWKTHRKSLRSGKHSNPHLQAAWNTYGEAAFTFEVLQEADVTLVIELEQEWIDRLGATERALGYNIRPHARNQLGFRHSPESKAKMSATRTGVKRPRSAEHARKIGDALRGRKLTAEHRAAVSHGMLGRKQSEVTREKIRQKHLGRTATPEARANMAAAHAGRYTLLSPDGVLTEIFNMRAFCREHALRQSHMADVARGKAKQHRGWRLP